MPGRGDGHLRAALGCARPCRQDLPGYGDHPGELPGCARHLQFTPSLIRQLDDLAAGPKTQYWVLAEVPAEELTPDQKRFILDRFFDTNSRVIARFRVTSAGRGPQRDGDRRGGRKRDGPGLPRPARPVQSGLDRPGLAGSGAASRAGGPGAGLHRGRQGPDLRRAPAHHPRGAALPCRVAAPGPDRNHHDPIAHPILPLLVDSNLAGIAMPEAELPTRFVYGRTRSGRWRWGAA